MTVKENEDWRRIYEGEIDVNDQRVLVIASTSAMTILFNLFLSSLHLQILHADLQLSQKD